MKNKIFNYLREGNAEKIQQAIKEMLDEKVDEAIEEAAEEIAERAFLGANLYGGAGNQPRRFFSLRRGDGQMYMLLKSRTGA